MRANFIFRIVTLTVFFIGVIKSINRCNNKSFKLAALDWSRNVCFSTTYILKALLLILSASCLFRMRNSQSITQKEKRTLMLFLGVIICLIPMQVTILAFNMKQGILQ